MESYERCIVNTENLNASFCNRRNGFQLFHPSSKNDAAIAPTSDRMKNGAPDISIIDQLADFQKLRISALTKAAEISHLVKEVTIGPNSPIKKERVNDEPPIKKENKHEENLIQDKVAGELRHTLLMKEYETRLQESSDELFKNLIDKMIEKRAETIRNFWNKQSEECERRSRELKARKLQMLRDLQENDNLSVLETVHLDQKKSQMINKQTIENMNRILEEQNKATSRFASITDSHTKIIICYNELTSLLQNEPLAKNISDKYMSSINTVIENINIIMDLSKTGTVTDKEVQQAEILSVNIDQIRKKVVEDFNHMKEQDLLKKQQEEEESARQKLAAKEAEAAEAAALAQMQKNLEEQRKKTGPMFYSQKNYAHHHELKTFLEQYEAQYKDLLENVNLKKFRFDCQKAVNTPINALSSVSGLHMKDKFDKLSKLLRGERVQVLDTYVTVTQHPQGLPYCTALLAKKIVRQGDLLVSSNPEAAFPLAALSVALCSQFPDFGKLLEANFHRQCPYLVPMFLPQKEGQTDKEFYLSRGYTYNEEGVVEKQDKFLKRMSGIFRLNCAIWIAKPPKFFNGCNPYGLSNGWQWLSSFINLRPEPDICATLLFDFFSVCGSEFLKCYGKQFTKIIRLISSEYLAILQNIDEGGPKTRLEVFLQNILKTGYISPPTGLLSQQSW